MVSGGELNVRIIYGLLTTLKKLLSENRKTKNDFVAVKKYLICDKYECYKVPQLNCKFRSLAVSPQDMTTEQKMRFSIKDFFSKWEHIFCAAYLVGKYHVKKL